MTLIKTSVLSFVATVFKISFGLVVNKLLAVYGGASAIALVGQFQNIQASLVGIATAGFGQGLIKYLAEFKKDAARCKYIFATAVKLVCLLLLPLSILVFVFSSNLSELLFSTSEYETWLQGLSVSLVPAALGLLFVSALNGLGEIRYLTLIGVISSLLGIGLALFLIPEWGASGAVAGLLLTPVFVLILSIWYLSKVLFFSWGWLWESVDSESSRRLGKFALMALTTAVSVPLAHIFIRIYLGESVSIEGAGLWTGLWRVSEAYLLVITMTLSVYYLPKLSSLADKNDLLAEMKYGYKLIMPFVIVSSLVIFLLRDWIVALLFTDAFSAMRELFFWQLVGDVIKIGCFLMGFVLLAKGLTTIYIIKEIIINVLFVFSTYVCVDQWGLIGVTYAYVVTYSVNLIWLVIIMRYYFKSDAKYRDRTV
ncbi:O-antigen translocase [Ghiorsea bivora]|uniref:O-antigen translocase n=1 Tax=Ghiorsea bivora TaxID=1485545 RepID=UPI00056F68C8|nr:O-antigen translocase [Ghiorsea bivora]